jgi:hypothetical protein
VSAPGSGGPKTAKRHIGHLSIIDLDLALHIYILLSSTMSVTKNTAIEGAPEGKGLCTVFMEPGDNVTVEEFNGE